MAKRAFDIIVSSLALLALAPLMLLLALVIKLDSPGPALFRQVRVGRHGVPFRIHKFRTMVVDAPQLGPSLTLAKDPRVTRVGRWLRDRRWDELPQLIDVLQGSMSLVGPRPEVPEYVVQYPQGLREAVLAVRPGITDPAALAHIDEAQLLSQATQPEVFYIQHILPAKLQLQAAYAQRATVWSDLGILFKTLKVLAWGHRTQARR